MPIPHLDLLSRSLYGTGPGDTVEDTGSVDIHFDNVDLGGRLARQLTF